MEDLLLSAMKNLLISAVIIFAFPLPARAQALLGTLEDLDAGTLKSMREQIKCNQVTDSNAKLVCSALATFEHADTPDAKFLDGKRFVGYSASITDQGTVAPSLELMVFSYRQTRDFHRAVELGDSLAAVPVRWENAEEEKQVKEAAKQIAEGKQPKGNPAYDYARRMNIDDKLGSTRQTNGKSIGYAAKNRMLLRQQGRQLIFIELAFQNSHVKGHSFWVYVLDLPAK